METVSNLTTYNISGADSPAALYASQSPHDKLSTLLVRVADGDRAALAELYDETSAILFGLLTHMLGHGAAAEEALVEVYSCVWRIAASYRPGDNSPMAWLVSTARECVLRNERPDAAIDPPLQTSESPEAAVIGVGGAEQPSSNAEAAREALRGLDPKQGEALRLCYFSGLRPVEMTFTLSIKDAKSLVRGALERYVEILRTHRVSG